MQDKPFLIRLGQTLEIAVYRGLSEQRLTFLGAYTDLESHDDASAYSKEEPPSSVSGKTIPGNRKLDFVLLHPKGGLAGIEVKNIREWLYPDRTEIRDMLFKCCYLDAVPVLIGRRIPFATFAVLNACGVIIHQTYSQRFPSADEGLANLVRDKNLLAYHDVRTGNECDPRLRKFLTTNLPSVLPGAREKFEEYFDLVSAYGSGTMGYHEFAGRVARRRRGENEDGEFPDRDEY